MIDTRKERKRDEKIDGCIITSHSCEEKEESRILIVKVINVFLLENQINQTYMEKKVLT